MKKNQLISTNNLKLFLYLFLFWSLAVAQPLMTIFGKQPEFLVAHEIRGWYLILLTITLNILIPFVFWFLIVGLGKVSKTLKEGLTRLTVVILLILFLLPFVNTFSNNMAYLTALVSSILLLYLLVKIEIVKTFALWFSPMCILFLLSFLFFSSAKQLLPSKSEATKLLTTQTDHSAPVFIFVLDEFPVLSLMDERNKINPTRFPNITKLLKKSTWYPNATTISSATAMALPSILSGVIPSYKDVRLATYEQYQDNLFSLFSSTHKINARENMTRMCPEELCKPLIKDPVILLLEDVLVTYAHTIYPQKKRKKLPSINDRWVGFLREINNEKKQRHSFSDRLNRFDSFIDSFDSFPENTLHFLHILIPHAPWRVLPDESLYAFYELEGVAGTMEKHDPASTYAHQWINDNWATELSWSRHLLQVGAVDSLIGKAISKIKDLGIYEESTIVILADHGAAFIPNKSRRFAHDENIPDIAGIPLIIKYPNQDKAIIDDRYASNLDILPTLLDIFSLKQGKEKMDGLSLLDKNIRQKPTPIYQEGGVVTEIPSNYELLIDKHLKTKAELFDKNGWSSVYNSKKSSEFFDTKVSSLEIKSTIKDAIRLENENLFLKINKDSKYVPAYYRIQSLIEAKISEILVAVNGKIVSQCKMFVHAPSDCAGLINPQVYRENNDNHFQFRFFSVLNNENDKYTVSELISQSITGATIEKNSQGESIKFKSGEILSIVNKQPYGSTVTRLVNNNSTYQIGGWAGNTETGKPAETLYVFIDDILFTTTHTGLKKPYLYDKFGLEELTKSGFEVTIPVDQYKHLENHNVRVFASSANGVTELNYTRSMKHEKLFGAFNSKTNRKIPINNSVLIANKVKNIKNINSLIIDAFNEDFKQLSSGDWLSINNHTQWLGSNASVIVPIKENSVTLSVSITAKPLLYPGKLDKQTLIISANNNPVKTIEFTELSSHEITIDLQAEDKSKPVVFTMEMPNSAAPADFVDSKDKRKLSLLITDFKIKVN